MMRYLVGLLLVGSLVGCAHKYRHDGPEGHAGCPHCEHKKGHKGKMGGGMMCKEMLGAQSASLLAVVQPLGKSKVNGSVQVVASGNDLKLKVAMKGLKANAKHGFHVHEFGNCASADGSTAGGHFNPGQKPHGGPASAERHAGDLGNLKADAKGEVTTEMTLLGVRLTDLVGRSFVVHAKEDDLTTQPAGAAGDRIACGVIGLMQ